MHLRAMSERDLRNAWSVFRAEAQPVVDAFRHCHTEPQTAQRKRLASILDAAKESLFGHEHEFASIDCYETYAQRVPRMDWQDLQPWVDKSCTTDKIVLSAEQPLFFEPTSGSSSAIKLIPYTNALLQEFQRAVVAWIAMLYDDCPEIAGGPMYWALSPPVPAHAPTANGIAVGGAGDAVYLAGSCAESLLGNILNPSHLSTQPNQWRAQTLAAMINAPDLRMISVWSPTFLIALLQPLETSTTAVDTLQQHLNHDQRATLKRALSRGSFEEFWPDLAVISCWMDGPCERYAKTLSEWFPQSRFSPKGLLATEGVVSISQGLKRPMSTGAR